MNAPAQPRMKLLLATIFVLNFIEFLQAGMLAFGASAIQGQINASPEEYSIVTAAYAAVAIASIAKMRWFIERLGWRKFIYGSIVFFITGAVISALSATFTQFLLGRIVMGLGGAAFMTSARMLVNLIPASPARMKGILSFASALTIGNAAAAWTVAELFEADWFAGIFVLLIALSLLAAALATAAVPDQPLPAEQHTSAHMGPLLAMAAGSFLVLFAIQRALYDFYSSLPYLLVLGLAGAAAIVWFVRHQHDHERPLLVLKRLVQKRYLAGLGVFVLAYVVLGANNVMLPSLMQRAMGFSWHSAGMIQSIGLSSAFLALIVKLRILKTSPSPKKFYVASFVSLAISAWMLSRLTVEANLWRNVLPAIAFFGMFVVVVQATTALHGFAELANDDVAFMHGQQVKNMLSQFGVALGIGGATLLQQWRTAEHLSVLNRRFASGDPELGRLLEQLTNAFGTTHGAQAGQVALGQLTQLLNQQAALLSGLEYFHALAIVSLAMGVLMYFQRTLVLFKPA
jgi:DHA2 family multidrug resistance protein